MTRKASLGERYGKALATASVIAGILALLSTVTIIGGLALGMLAIALGGVGARWARQEGASYLSRAVAGAGAGIVAILLAGFFFALGYTIYHSPKTDELKQCVQRAGTDQLTKDRCVNRFIDSVG